MGLWDTKLGRPEIAVAHRRQNMGRPRLNSFHHLCRQWTI